MCDAFALEVGTGKEIDLAYFPVENGTILHALSG